MSDCAAFPAMIRVRCVCVRVFGLLLNLTAAPDWTIAVQKKIGRYILCMCIFFLGGGYLHVLYSQVVVHNPLATESYDDNDSQQ